VVVSSHRFICQIKLDIVCSCFNVVLKCKTKSVSVLVVVIVLFNINRSQKKTNENKMNCEKMLTYKKNV
jgi:hypothetical protein